MTGYERAMRKEAIARAAELRQEGRKVKVVCITQSIYHAGPKPHVGLSRRYEVRPV